MQNIPKTRSPEKPIRSKKAVNNIPPYQNLEPPEMIIQKYLFVHIPQSCKIL